MAYLKILDPLNNEVFFDHKSIGLALLNSELSSFTHDIIRKTLCNPTAILEVDKENRIYIAMIFNSMIRCVDVIYTGNYWYVKDIDLEKGEDELLSMIRKYNVIYKK